MPTITKIISQRRSENRRNVYLDGRFAFGCNTNVVARFRLCEGLNLTPEQLREIEYGEVKQECFDKAMKFLQQRLHSRAELHKKLGRKEWGAEVIDATLNDLARLGYLDDERFARTKALGAAEHKRHGRRRAFVELIRSGVRGDVATAALDDVYSKTDSIVIARDVARKNAERLKKLDRVVARRRLAGLLQRRGFGYDTIRPVIDEVLGEPRDE
ncbi:MAG: regulatory protein RecX [Tepidisphaeraceae bacterium]